MNAFNQPYQCNLNQQRQKRLQYLNPVKINFNSQSNIQNNIPQTQSNQSNQTNQSNLKNQLHKTKALLIFSIERSLTYSLTTLLLIIYFRIYSTESDKNPFLIKIIALPGAVVSIIFSIRVFKYKQINAVFDLLYYIIYTILAFKEQKLMIFVISFGSSHLIASLFYKPQYVFKIPVTTICDLICYSGIVLFMVKLESDKNFNVLY